MPASTWGAWPSGQPAPEISRRRPARSRAFTSAIASRSIGEMAMPISTRRTEERRFLPSPEGRGLRAATLMNHDSFIPRLRALALDIRAAVLRTLHAAAAEELASPVAERGGDTIYRLDLPAEEALIAYCAQWSRALPFL